MRKLVLLFAVVLVVSCSQSIYPVRLYSCDNLQVLGGSPCFPPEDEKHMTVVLRDKPMGEVFIRLKEDGNGLVADVFRRNKAPSGDWWLQVRCQGKAGWIAEHFSRKEETTK